MMTLMAKGKGTITWTCTLSRTVVLLKMVVDTAEIGLLVEK